jgi:hypothetical protein
MTDKVFVFRLENEVSPLSFVALVPDGSHYTLPDSSQIDDHGESSQSFVALVPDSTHHAPPISSQEEDSSLTLKEITARERSRLIKRAQRQNAAFRYPRKTTVIMPLMLGVQGIKFYLCLSVLSSVHH